MGITHTTSRCGGNAAGSLNWNAFSGIDGVWRFHCRCGYEHVLPHDCQKQLRPIWTWLPRWQVNGEVHRRLHGNDFLAESLGLRNSQIPYLHPNATGEQILQGVSFASGGSGYLKSTSSVLNVIPAFQQFEVFLKYKIKISDLVGREKASSFFSEALYFISAGSNDFILNYLPINSVVKERYSRTDGKLRVLQPNRVFEGRAKRAFGRVSSYWVSSCTDHSLWKRGTERMCGGLEPDFHCIQ
ncbi:GDSL esterase/lipase At5g03820 [Physcomitrium patens]|uniref:GDSL esterase/lipase At5g03820 n=1 Tax=Physcomitrium patens TaxID=3218 RepID=UPI003CCE1FD7